MNKENYCLICGKNVSGEPHPMIVAPDGKVLASYPMHIHEQELSDDQ